MPHFVHFDPLLKPLLPRVLLVPFSAVQAHDRTLEGLPASLQCSWHGQFPVVVPLEAPGEQPVERVKNQSAERTARVAGTAGTQHGQQGAAAVCIQVQPTEMVSGRAVA